MVVTFIVRSIEEELADGYAKKMKTICHKKCVYWAMLILKAVTVT